MHAELQSEAKYFDVYLYLYLHLYFVCAYNDVSAVTVRLQGLTELCESDTILILAGYIKKCLSAFT